jgi:acyl phosphate:glycerol-3-phosphate acyltransferase
MTQFIIAATVAYLIGSIPFGYILVKIFLKQDIRQTGSGNIGATNVARSGKKGLAIATLLLDAGKGALAVFVALIFLRGDFAIVSYSKLTSFIALCVIAGHVFPVWLRFRGGKGVATAVGAFAMLAPDATVVTVVVFALVFTVTRYVSLGSVISAAAFPFLAYTMDWWMRNPPAIIGAALSSLLIILKHHANIRRLLAGTEPKFGTKGIGTTDPIQTEKNV